MSCILIGMGYPAFRARGGARYGDDERVIGGRGCDKDARAIRV